MNNREIVILKLILIKITGSLFLMGFGVIVRNDILNLLVKTIAGC